MSAGNVRVYENPDPTAPPVATETIGGEEYQKVRPGWGPTGTHNDTDDADGKRLPVGGGQIGTLTEAAPASDTASSGLNGRLQRIAQRLTSLIALFPTALGQSTMANSFRVVVASDQSTLNIAKSGKPSTISSNGQVTANTTAATLIASNASRKCVILKNIGTVTVYIGKATVTTANGFPLAPQESFTDDETTALWQGITASSSTTVAVIEV